MLPGNFSLLANQFGHSFTAEANMAYVSVDVRGTGASTGRFMSLWSLRERSDSIRVLEWITAQPWWVAAELGLLTD